MPDLLKIIVFLVVALIGFFTVSIVFYIAHFTGAMPEAIPDESLAAFKTTYFGGTLWAWIAGVAVALGSFFVRGKAARWLLLWAPVYIPAGFAIASLWFFR